MIDANSFVEGLKRAVEFWGKRVSAIQASKETIQVLALCNAHLKQFRM